VREDVTELEVYRLSAEALGVAVRERAGALLCGPFKDSELIADVWNPLLNAEQRWECVEFLLLNNSTLILSGDGEENEWYQGHAETLIGIHERGPASEFPARAVAELQRRKA
jgi:hypothetical protein